MRKFRIGVISDTHLTDQDLINKSSIFHRLEWAKIEIFDNVDIIIHCGDITGKKVIDYLRNNSKVYAVQGNCDNKFYNNKQDLLKIKKLSIEDLKVIIAHKREDLYPYINDDINVFLFGHSHIPSLEIDKEYNRYWINPGALKRPSGEKRKPSVCKIEINEKNEIKVKFHFYKD